MQQRIWLNFDLGIKGDYPNLYKWLDKKKAVECGNNVAFFSFEYNSDLPAELLQSIRAEVTLNTNDRIYVIYTRLASTTTTQGAEGKFIFGNRKATIWLGASGTEGESIDTSNG